MAATSSTMETWQAWIYQKREETLSHPCQLQFGAGKEPLKFIVHTGIEGLEMSKKQDESGAYAILCLPSLYSLYGCY